MLSIPAKNSYRLPALFIILIILGAQWGLYSRSVFVQLSSGMLLISPVGTIA